MVWVDVLRSQSSGRLYVGVSDRPGPRLAEHNAGQTASTRGRGPWELAWTESHPDRESAMARERQIKSWKSARCIEELLLGER
jgi:putative endonuclease